MPRGNDADAAEKELRARLGGEELNAEKLIQADAARWPAELRAANQKPIDTNATAALNWDDVAAKIEGELKDFAVRGKHVVAVIEDDLGHPGKVAIALEDFGKKVAAAVEKTKAASAPTTDPTTETAAS